MSLSPTKKKLKGEDGTPFDSNSSENPTNNAIEVNGKEELMKSNTDSSEKVAEENGELRQNMQQDDVITEENAEKLQCPFLGLPKKLITHILSFLPPKDRLRARVNKRLNEIEAESKFEVKELRIVEIPDIFRRLSLRYPQDMFFSDENPYSYNCLRRLFSNTSIESLTVTLEAEGNLGRASLYDKVCSLIKEFKNVGQITVHFEFCVYIMDGSFLLDLVESCEGLTLVGVDNISSEALHSVYQTMLNVSGKIRKFECVPLYRYFYWFLYRIRIEIVDGFIFSNRDIEAFTKITNSRRMCFIFDGNIEIAFFGSRDPDSMMELVLKLHETEESLEEAKNEEGMVRVTIYEAGEEEGFE